MTEAVDAPRSRVRRACATEVSQRVTGWSGAVHRWWYHPGDVTPAPYPDAVASRECVHGTQVSDTLRFRRPFSARLSAAADGSRPARTGACHAPHTTATRSRPARSVARSTCRIQASRSTSCGSCASSSPSRSAAIASVRAGNGDAPSIRDSTTSSHQRSASS
jgi:hypothetical protein